MELKIGDRVKVREYEDIPENLRTKGAASLCGEVGTVADKLWSEGNDCYVYRIRFDGFNRISSKMWTADFFELFIEHPVEYKYEFDVANNVVIAVLYEVVGDRKTELARGHGHIIHEGVVGIAQASSYALKRIFMDVNGGSF